MNSTKYMFGLESSTPDYGFHHFKSFKDYETPVVHQDSFLNLVVYVTDPEAIKQITVQQKWKKTDEINTMLEILLGSGLVTIEGNIWKRHRNLIMPSFSQQNLQNMDKKIVFETNRLLDLLEKNNEILIFPNFIKNVSEMTLSLILSIGFGTEPSITSELAKNFSDLIKNGLPVMVLVSAFGRWIYSMPLPIITKYKGIKKSIEKKIESIVDQRRNSIDSNGDGFQDLLSLMMDASDEEGKNFSKQELFDECLTFLFAGHDTTSSALNYLFFQLAKNPKLQQEVYEEITYVLKEESPNFENVKKLNLLLCCIKESLRMCPPVVTLARWSDKDEDLAGYALPKNTICHLNVVGLHYSEKYWENPEEFNPRRWNNIDEQKLKFCYFPFSVGQRDCAGKNLAMLEAKIISSILIQRYELFFPKDFNPETVSMELVVVLKLKNLQIQFKKRK